VESHPYVNQDKLNDFCSARGVRLTAFAPLASPARPWSACEQPITLLEDARLKAMAERYGKSPAQICLRYQVLHSTVTLEIMPVLVHAQWDSISLFIVEDSTRDSSDTQVCHQKADRREF
jgi:aldehyde reductase